MNLEAWLRQNNPLAEQLKVVEGLCSAVNEAHQKGVLHRALEPANIEVLADGRCDLQGAVRSEAATPAAARYRAPEVLEGSSYSPRADIYSVGVICYEMLSGRNPSVGERPKPLSELRADVSRDLTDAIMGCMEAGPDWRPRDLSYLLQVVGAMAGAGGKPAARPAKAAESPRVAVAAPRKPAARGTSSRSNVPLIAVALVILVGAAGGAWFWLQSHGPSPAVPDRASAPPTPEPAVSLPGVASASPPPVTPATPSPKPTAEPEKAATPVPGRDLQTRSNPQATPLPTLRPQPESNPAGTKLAEGFPVPPTPTPGSQEPSEPAVLTAVSPLSLRHPTTAMLDLRGIGLRPDHQARFMKIKTPPNGITVVKQKYVSPTLIQVVVKLDETAAPGTYGIDVEDAQGASSNTLVFTVTK